MPHSVERRENCSAVHLHECKWHILPWMNRHLTGAWNVQAPAGHGQAAAGTIQFGSMGANGDDHYSSAFASPPRNATASTAPTPAGPSMLGPPPAPPPPIQQPVPSFQQPAPSLKKPLPPFQQPAPPLQQQPLPPRPPPPPAHMNNGCAACTQCASYLDQEGCSGSIGLHCFLGMAFVKADL